LKPFLPPPPLDDTWYPCPFSQRVTPSDFIPYYSMPSNVIPYWFFVFVSGFAGPWLLFLWYIFSEAYGVLITPARRRWWGWLQNLIFLMMNFLRIVLSRMQWWDNCYFKCWIIEVMYFENSHD
jgi:hypothetical protein